MSDLNRPDPDDLDPIVDVALSSAPGDANGPHADNEAIAGYASGALSADEHASIVAHLTTCDECRAIAADVAFAIGPVEEGSTSRRLRPLIAIALAASLALVAGWIYTLAIRPPAWRIALDRGQLVAAAKLFAADDPTLRALPKPPVAAPRVWRDRPQKAPTPRTPSGPTLAPDGRPAFEWAPLEGAVVETLLVRWLDGETSFPVSGSSATYPTDASTLPRADTDAEPIPIQWALRYETVGGRTQTTAWRSFTLASAETLRTVQRIDTAIDAQLAADATARDLRALVRANALASLGLRDDVRRALATIATAETTPMSRAESGR